MRLSIYNKFREFKAGRRVYYIKSLNRYTLANSIEYCRSKCTGHENSVIKVGFIKSIIYYTIGFKHEN